ncbi:cryptococcal mannosyltransferase 1-domain-containing protein [Mrakia frigida]|uniref:glycosyltransferase family 69 protein n=1 Tax=Mrakia frigida TaxID=29902 RepID=UPI003FCC0CD0
MVTISIPLPFVDDLLFRLPSRRHALLAFAFALTSIFLILSHIHNNAILPLPPVRSLKTDIVWGGDPGGEFKRRLERLDDDLRLLVEGRGQIYNGTVYTSTLTEDQVHRYDSLRGDNSRHRTPLLRRDELNTSSSYSTDSSSNSTTLSTRAVVPARGRILITSNFFQTAPLLPDFLATIANLVHYLGPERLVFSVLEGPSTDGTPDILADIMLPMLLDMGVERKDIHLRLNWPRKNWEWRNRIEALAELRNEALEPLWKYPPPEGWEAVVFLNDVYTSAAHVLELVHLHIEESAGVTCAWDNYYYPGSFWHRPRQTFYDAWVARSHSSGDTFYAPHKQFSLKNLFHSSPLEKARYQKGLPLQSMSCWNGIAVLDARPFLEVGKGIPKRRKAPSTSTSAASNGKLVHHPAALAVKKEEENEDDEEERESVPPVRFRKSRGGKDGECSQSECFLICRDFWRWGLGKVQIVPSVRVGYVREMADWLATERVEIGIRRDEKGIVLRDGKERRIDWVKDPPEQVKCFPWPDLPGLVHDPWKSPEAGWVDSLEG